MSENIIFSNLSLNSITDYLNKNETEKLFKLIVEPIYDELTTQQDITIINKLSSGQQMFILYDFVRTQVLQGGFIQLIQNKYISFLIPLCDKFPSLELYKMSQIFDNVLKIYSLNVKILGKETNLDEFVSLYNEFKEFEHLDQEFINEDPICLKIITNYILQYPNEFHLRK